MKAEERHELQQNDLAGWMYHVPMFLRQYGSYLLFGVALLILAYQLYGWHQAKQEAKRQEAWSTLIDASGNFGMLPPDPNRLRTAIQEYNIHPLQALAYKSIGDFYLQTLTIGQSPLPKITVTPAEAEQEAYEAYNKVISSYGDELLPAGQAHLGLGKLYETKQQWDKAREQYQILTDKKGPFAAMPLATEAQRRLEKLDEWRKPVVLANTPAAGGPIALPESGPIGPMNGGETPGTAPASAPATQAK